MGTAVLKLKIMPESPKTKLEDIKSKIQESLKKVGAIKIQEIKEQEIAFGLKALIVTLAWPESLGTEKAELAAKIPGVSSVQIIDYRRAFG